MGALYFIHSHDYSHYVFPIHYGGSQDVLGLVLCEVVHKVTEMLILRKAEAGMGRQTKRNNRTIQSWQGNGDISTYPASAREGQANITCATEIYKVQ